MTAVLKLLANRSHGRSLIRALSIVLLLASSGVAHGQSPAAAQEPATEVSIDSKSLAAIKASVESKPEDVALRLRYASMLRALLRFDAAREQARAAVEITKDSADAWLELARIELLAGKRGVAGSHAQKAAKLGASPEALELLERLSAVVRMNMGRRDDHPQGSDLAVATEFLEHLRAEEFDAASSLLVWPQEGTSASSTLSAYGAFLSKVGGVRWTAFEVAPMGKGGLVRVRLMWRVSPVSTDFDALAALPPGFEAVLPFDWARGLRRVSEQKLRNEALARARAAEWGDVSLATIVVEQGKIVSVIAGGAELLEESLPVVAEVARVGDGAGTGGAVDEKTIRRDMFKNRYGKQEKTEGPPYMYRQILFGLVIVACFAVFLVWLVRRETKTPDR